MRTITLGRGDGYVVSVLTFYSDDPSSNPAEAYSLSVKLCLKRMKINKNMPGLAHLIVLINWRNFSLPNTNNFS